MNETGSEDTLVQYDGGGIYTMSGEEVVAPVEPITPVDAAPETVSMESSAAEAQPTAQVGTMRASGEANAETTAASLTPSGGQVTFANVDNLIEHNYNSTVPSFNVELCLPASLHCTSLRIACESTCSTDSRR